MRRLFRYFRRRRFCRAMDRILCAVAILLFACASNAAELADDVLGPDGLYNVERKMIEATNAERAKQGLKPLAVDLKLQETARRQATLQISRGMNHGYTSGWSAENIAAGQRSWREAISAWLHSSGHRRNLMGNYRFAGMAGMRRGNGSIQWTQQFR